ncbi:MAG TPA: hypothetical protein VMT73_11100 [Anaerolineales bacterium]|nr:hypothetical protein [Anaerolineales bacterium]
MSKEDEIRDVLKQAVKTISEAERNPRAWQSWMVYLLSQLEVEATKSSSTYSGSFADMLAALQDAIRNRMRTGGWN